MVKGIWSAIFSIPAIVIVIFLRDPEVLVTYTGGICGVFVLFLFPLILVYHARQKIKARALEDEKFAFNPNASPFQHWIWHLLILGFSLLTLTMVLLGIINGTAGN